LALFVKYDFWHFYLQELKFRKIETILVSGIFRSSQPFFSWWGSFHRNMLQSFTHLFVQNMESKELLNKIGLGEHTTVAGDTRFDRVLATAQQWKPVEQIEHFIDYTKKVLVAGSTWKEDENLLADWFNENEKEWQLIIAPHEIKAENITRLKTLFPNAMCFSEIEINRSGKSAGSCLIIDNIGYLSKLYHYATLCYVGGGFNTSGHHNIIEAAVYGKCVITGPYYLKFKESVDLKKMGASFTIENSKQLTKLMQTLNIKASGRIAALYVEENSGATDKIYHWIQEKRLFTKA
jgi:3-deoxy-D-manno-octulosonic-acid transferase